MSVCNSFFERCVCFEAIDCNRIKTIDFLNASKSVVQFVELLGKAFFAVRNDMNGNITKLMKIYETNRLKYQYLDEILRTESQTLTESEFHLGTDALLWLSRALNYNHIFLSLFLLDFEDGKRNEDLTQYFSKAYEQTLKKHHNWFVQQICSLCLISAPNRSSLLLYLSDNKQTTDENIIFSAIKQYLIGLKTNIETIHKNFSDFNIDYL